MRLFFASLFFVFTPFLLTYRTADYKYALTLSLLFYDAQKSGHLEPDFRVDWRKSSALNDGKESGVDLVGGYYDAGDHVKFLLPMANSMTLLAWSGTLGKREEANLGNILRWGTDWILKTKTGEKVYVQVGDPKLDHSFMGPPEKMKHSRPAFYVDANKPGTEPVAEAAAALASSSVFWKGKDNCYALYLASKAEEYYTFSSTHRGMYHLAVPQVKDYYASHSGYYDELAWAATWLYLATKKYEYLIRARQLFDDHLANSVIGNVPCWDNKSGYALLLLTAVTKDEELKALSKKLIKSWVDGKSPVTYTPGGLAWVREWGSLRYTANMAFLALFYHKHIAEEPEFYKFGKRQINYILGSNPRNSSYLIGFGSNPPKNPHHRGANYQKSRQLSYSVLSGALVGGPTKADDFAYNDCFSDYKSNEVALDYNAGLTGALMLLSN